MDAIKNYLDNMFANLPGTPGVLRAKKELGQMMEDKYSELIAEGKSENEAVGSVISEFGNLSELAEALGLEKEIKEQKAEAEEKSYRMITVEEAAGYIKMRNKRAIIQGLAIACCIIAPIIPIWIGSGLSGIPEIFEPITFFISVMVGVGLFIYAGTLKRKWSFIRSETCTLSMDTTKYVTDEQERFYGSYTAELICGIVCCAGAWVPAAVFDEFSGYGDTLGGIFFFLAIALGVFLLRHANGRRRSYRKLLNLNKKGTMKASYKAEDSAESAAENAADRFEDRMERFGENVEKSMEKKEEIKYISPVAESFMDLYWPTVICLYLCASFITFQWGLTWIIWPVAGILHGVFRKNLTE